MLNRVVLVGRLTKDPELRYTPSGVATAQFSLAVNRNFKNQQGEREADFINIVTWRQTAEFCANYLRKGGLVATEGRIQTRHYDNNEGRRVYVTEVVADNVQSLSSPSSSNREEGYSNRDEGYGNTNQSAPSSQSSSRRGNQSNDSDPFSDDGSPVDISDDDLPF